MKLLNRNLFVSITLALSDFFGFIASLYLAIGVLSISFGSYEIITPSDKIEGWIALHWLLAFCCVGLVFNAFKTLFYRKKTFGLN